MWSCRIWATDGTHQIVAVIAIVRHDPLSVGLAFDDPDRMITLAPLFGQVGGFEEDRDGSLVRSTLTASCARDDVRLELLVEGRVERQVVIVEMMLERTERSSSGLGQRGRGRSGPGGFERILGDGLAGLDGLQDTGLGRVVAGEERVVFDAAGRER